MVQPTILLTPSKSAIPAAGGVLEVLVRVQASTRLPPSVWRWWLTAPAA